MKFRSLKIYLETNALSTAEKRQKLAAKHHGIYEVPPFNHGRLPDLGSALWTLRKFAPDFIAPEKTRKLLNGSRLYYRTITCEKKFCLLFSLTR